MIGADNQKKATAERETRDSQAQEEGSLQDIWGKWVLKRFEEQTGEL